MRRKEAKEGCKVEWHVCELQLIHLYECVLAEKIKESQIKKICLRKTVGHEERMNCCVWERRRSDAHLAL